MLAFLEPLEQIQLQLGNHFCYDVLVSRVQTQLKLVKMVYFTTGVSNCYAKTLFALNPLTSEFTQISFEGNEKVKFYDFRIVQAGDALYALQLDGDRPLRFL